MFPTIVSCSTLRTQIKTTEKKIVGHRTRFRRNDDFPLWRGLAVKKKLPFSNGHVLITCEIMHSGDALGNTGE